LSELTQSEEDEMRRAAILLAVLPASVLVLAGYQPAVALLGTAPVTQATAPVADGQPARVVNGRLAFEREAPAGDHTQTDIYTVRSNGSGQRALTSTPDANEFGPAWNPAGTAIAFWRTPAPFGPGTIWTMDAAGGNQRQLTHGIDARDPTWNPAGTRIAFTLAGATGFHIWTMRGTDGGDLHQVTSGPGTEFEPAWSPDGTRIAYTHGLDEGDPGDICLITVQSLATSCVTGSPDYDHQVAWSADGARLVFERDSGPAASIFVIDADGSDLSPLTSGPFFDVGPCFSPDGRFVAFGSDRSGAFLDDLWTVRTDNRHLHRLTRSAFSEAIPDWQAG
jgi:Tol biopolymer transport system component